MGKFDSIDDLKSYVKEYLKLHNMSKDDLMVEVKECIERLDYNIEESVSNVEKMSSEADELEEELGLLKYLLKGKK